MDRLKIHIFLFVCYFYRYGVCTVCNCTVDKFNIRKRTFNETYSSVCSIINKCNRACKLNISINCCWSVVLCSSVIYIKKMVNSILIPTPEQIQELRKLFLEKLDSEGAPSTCVGEWQNYFLSILLFPDKTLITTCFYKFVYISTQLCRVLTSRVDAFYKANSRNSIDEFID